MLRLHFAFVCTYLSISHLRARVFTSDLLAPVFRLRCLLVQWIPAVGPVCRGERVGGCLG